MITSRIRSMREMVQNRDLLYSINNYQRFYVWETDKVTTYLSDISKVIQRQDEPTPPKHFFGQFIKLKVDEDDRGRKTYEVIDGQQRLTTFLLLIASVRGRIHQIGAEQPDLRTTANTIVNECDKFLYSIKDGAVRKNKFALSVRDNEYFIEIINSLSTNGLVSERSQYISHVHLFHAQDCICTWISNELSQHTTPEEQLAFLNSVVDTAADSFQLVVLIPTSQRYTYRLYQVVNDRGEPLRDSELLKAKSIEILDASPELLPEAQRIWDDILSDSGKDTESYLNGATFLRLGKRGTKIDYIEHTLKSILPFQTT